MGGSRHSKNAGTMGSEAQTYHERKALGYGTVRERLGKDAAGNFDDCRLTLQPVQDPMCTPAGVLFSREAILENLLAQKKANKRKLAAWEAQQEALAREAEERKSVDAQAALAAFDRQNHAGASDALAASLQEAIKEGAEEFLAEKRVVSGAVNIRTNREKMKGVNAFWVPSATPESRQLVDKPDVNTYCPATGKKLRLKDLIPVKFTKVKDGSGEGRTGRFCDPVTGDVFTNASRLVLLKPTGDVVTKQTWDKCIKPDGAFDGKPIKEKDAIELVSGGTGFAAHDKERTEAKQFWALGPGSGRQDLRGQHTGTRSAFGLSFSN